MKTFLGFTTGLLVGLFGGIYAMAVMMVSDRSLLEYTKSRSDELFQ